MVCEHIRKPKTVLEYIQNPFRQIKSPARSDADDYYTYTNKPFKIEKIKINQAWCKRSPMRLSPPNLVKPGARMNSKPKDISSKFPFNKITNFKGVINYKIIRKIQRKIQANAPTIQSEIGGGQNGLLSLEIQKSTY